MLKTPILITGCQRSGTTLMRMILNSHPDILSIDEDRFHYPSINTYMNAQWLPSFVCFKLPQYAPLLSFLKSLPNMKIVWCIRGPQDVVWSMIKLKIKLDHDHSVSWTAHPTCAQAEIINSIWSLDEKTREELSGDMKRFLGIASKHPLDWSREENIFTGALCWAIKNTLPGRYKEEGIDFHAVRYEELVTTPKKIIKSILDYIGVDWSEEILQHHQKHEGISIGGTSNTRPIDSRSVGQGMVNFTHEETEQIRIVCGGIASSWEYK